MPSRYIQTIYKQYTIFLKDRQAQEAAAAEEMMEELEDGASMGGGSTKSSNTNNKSKELDSDKSLKELQLERMMRDVAQGLDGENQEE